MTCIECRHTWDEDPSVSQAGVQCPECFAVMPLTVAAKGAQAVLQPEPSKVSPESRTEILPPKASKTVDSRAPTLGVHEAPTITPTSDTVKPRKFNIVPDREARVRSVSSAGEKQLRNVTSEEQTELDSRKLTEGVASTPFENASPKEVDLSGQTVGGYEVKHMLGAGGMGAVCLARQVSLDRDVALKILPGRMAKNPEFLMRFTREALSAAQLTHHNIIQVYDVGNQQDVHYISMEFVRGENLGNLVRKDGKLSPDDAAGYVLQAARGLKYAHENGIVHRDIKPDNLMVNEHGIVKIADMGLAKMRGEVERTGERRVDPTILRQARGDITMAEIAMGTPAYMSPEQAKDASSVDARADQYSLGCTLYYLCAGKPPYSGSTAIEILSKHMSEPVPPLEAHVRSLPPALSTVVRKMLEKKPDDRYPGMAGVIRDLEAYLGLEAEKGAYTPREQHMAVLEKEQAEYYSAGCLLRRKAAIAGFFVLMPVLIALSLMVWKADAMGVAGGLLGLLIMTPIAEFVFDGLLNKAYLFRRVRSVFFGMTLRGWATTFLSVALTLGVLWALGLVLPWLGFAVVAVGLAVAYQKFVARPLRAERSEAIRNMQEMLKQLRLRGVSEEALQDFVCRFSGQNWEEFFEELFGYEAMVIARAKWASAEQVKPRKRYAIWRDPIAQWLLGIETRRKELREKRQLAKAEARRLKAQGVSEKEAEKKAGEVADAIMTEGLLKPTVIVEDMAELQKSQKLHAIRRRVAFQERCILYYRLARMLLGLVVCVLIGVSLVRGIRLPFLKPIEGMLYTYYGLGAGVVLFLSAYSTRIVLPLLSVLGAAMVIGMQLIYPRLAPLVPGMSGAIYLYASLLVLAVPLALSFLAKAVGRKF
jgi:eukaryotic-like serine/threonine-protein kinase